MSETASGSGPSNPAAGTAVANQEHLAGKYLTFRTGDEEFGLGILTVQEIIGMMKVTRVPRVPEFIRGVINLRGKVIPIVDLRCRFGLPSTEDTARTCIVVVQVRSASGPVTMGIIVDEVSEVLDVPGATIEPPPRFGAGVDTAFLLGVGKVGHKVVMLLDIDRVLTTDQIATVAETAG